MQQRYQQHGADYPLFPAGKLVTRKDSTRALGKGGTAGGKELSKRTLFRLFLEIEDAAGVPRVRGRALYGPRRLNVEASLDEDVSERGLIAAGRWTDPAVPHGIHGDKLNEAGEIEAMQIRAKNRGEILPVPDAPEQQPTAPLSGGAYTARTPRRGAPRTRRRAPGGSFGK